MILMDLCRTWWLFEWFVTRCACRDDRQVWWKPAGSPVPLNAHCCLSQTIVWCWAFCSKYSFNLLPQIRRSRRTFSSRQDNAERDCREATRSLCANFVSSFTFVLDSIRRTHLMESMIKEMKSWFWSQFGAFREKTDTEAHSGFPIRRKRWLRFYSQRISLLYSIMSSPHLGQGRHIFQRLKSSNHGTSLQAVSAFQAASFVVYVVGRRYWPLRLPTTEIYDDNRP